MIAKRNYVTEKGLESLRAELNRLLNVERLELVERLADAATDGDWMDSLERNLVEEELSFVEARIRALETLLATAEIIPPDSDPLRVNVGNTVVLEAPGGAIETYTIVGPAETDPQAGLISDQSPLGTALLNRRAGDEVIVQAPDGNRRYRVIALE